MSRETKDGGTDVINTTILDVSHPLNIKQSLAQRFPTKPTPPKPGTPKITSPTETAARLVMERYKITGIDPVEELKKPHSLFKSFLAEIIALRQYDKYLAKLQDFYLDRIAHLRELYKALKQHPAEQSNIIQFPYKDEKDAKVYAPVPNVDSIDQEDQTIAELGAKYDEIKELRRQLDLAQQARLALFKQQRLELKMQNRSQVEILANRLGLKGQARKDFVAKLEHRGLDMPQAMTSIKKYYKNHHEDGLSVGEAMAYNAMRLAALKSEQNIKKMTVIMEMNVIFAIRQLTISPKEKQKYINNIKNIITHLQTFADDRSDLVQRFQNTYVRDIQQEAESNQRKIDTLTADEIKAVKSLRESMQNLQANPDLSKQLSSNNHFQQFVKTLSTTLVVYEFEKQRVERQVKEVENYFDLKPAMIPRPEKTQMRTKEGKPEPEHTPPTPAR